MVEKRYIAKVIGVFPEDEVSYSSSLNYLCNLHSKSAVDSKIADIFWLRTYIFLFCVFCTLPQQVVNANVSFNAREGRSTVKVKTSIPSLDFADD